MLCVTGCVRLRQLLADSVTVRECGRQGMRDSVSCCAGIRLRDDLVVSVSLGAAHDLQQSWREHVALINLAGPAWQRDAVQSRDSCVGTESGVHAAGACLRLMQN